MVENKFIITGNGTAVEIYLNIMSVTVIDTGIFLTSRYLVQTMLSTLREAA